MGLRRYSARDQLAVKDVGGLGGWVVPGWRNIYIYIWAAFLPVICIVVHHNDLTRKHTSFAQNSFSIIIFNLSWIFLTESVHSTHITTTELGNVCQARNLLLGGKSDSGNTEPEMDIVENSDKAGFDFNLFGSL